MSKDFGNLSSRAGQICNDKPKNKMKTSQFKRVWLVTHVSLIIYYVATTLQGVCTNFSLFHNITSENLIGRKWIEYLEPSALHAKEKTTRKVGQNKPYIGLYVSSIVQILWWNYILGQVGQANQHFILRPTWLVVVAICFNTSIIGK